MDLNKILSKEYISQIKKLNSPKKIQDFINSLDANFEPNGDECRSPLTVLKTKKAHCIEGAILAALILNYHGYKPLILDFETIDEDFDHVVAVFKKDGFWGAISKTNHAISRYREPVYKTVRELAMSHFHEYFLERNGYKTLRTYSDPINLNIFKEKNWIITEKNIWFIPKYLAKVKHHKILNKKQIANLRPADEIEIKTSKIVQQEKPLQ